MSKILSKSSSKSRKNLNLLVRLVKSKRPKDRKLAISSLKELILLRPSNSLHHYQLACCLDYLGQEKEAEIYYANVWRLGVHKLDSKEQPGFFIGYGSTLRNNRKFAKAVKILKLGARKFPQSQALTTFLALALYSQKKYKAAARLLFEVNKAHMNQKRTSYFRAIKDYVENL